MLKPLALTLALLGAGLSAPAAAATAQEWRSCPHDKIGMVCTDFQVPADWSKPDGRTITLKLGRLKATGASEGSVLVAYGGPGGPGIALTQANPGWWAKLRERMDIVTWDTRGYGEQFQGLSTGLQCSWTRVPLPDAPEDDAAFGRLSDTNRGYAEACRLKDPELFAHMSSADHARDMEAIRKFLGDGELNFYGASYAGIYGQAYARLFPGRIRTMVLDGTINHSTASWKRELEESARANERFLQRFFAWCRSNDCSDVPGRWRALIARADRTPVPTTTPNVAYNGRDLQSFAISRARQGKPAWPDLAQAIRKAAQADASGFVPARGARYPDQATGVTECTDWPRFADREEMAATHARLRKIAPNAGTANTLSTATLGCIDWPVPVTNKPASLPKGLPPLLGAGAWGESDAVARALSPVPGSAVIHHDGPGHTLYGFNECARDHINSYFTDRAVPAETTPC
ncbi:alpha/beta fold hydrolase [Nonomuraea diastatica]|uniref:Alpha/beta fold hydrolase n=1 Tax=Nonomuraea diastatica TaxID=1848329 RepID=A0A4R4W337_9ACTN|nr:alpha/beta fold hydrolase [Nonomuraea diastatica]TDD10313.1 alpha/beta fold hydrolase [Nonomuraea diastatica]